jgi:endoglucanase
MTKDKAIDKIVLWAVGTLLWWNLSAYAQTGSVASGPMRGWTRAQYVNDMYLGWNLGNTMDASGGETGWGNPVTTQAMVDAVHKMGFKFLRLPVTWKGHFGSNAPYTDGNAPYTIDPTWLARVVTIANYALNDSMYVMINTHHDGTTGGWYNLAATGATVTSTASEVAAIWTQIANAFKTYGDYVVFEVFNEPQNGAANQYGGGDSLSRANLATYQIAAVNAIRATGGNNAVRLVVLQGISASPIAVSVATIPMVDKNCLVSIHTYDPNNFSMNCNPSTWGATADTVAVMKNLAAEQSMMLTKGLVAIIGEWGTESCDDLASRVHHAQFYARECRNHGMLPVWWDNGAEFMLLNRKTDPPSCQFPTIVQALVNGARAGVFPPDLLAEVKPSPGNVLSGQNIVQLKARTFTYTLSGTSSITLSLYTIQGKFMVTLVKTKQPAGTYDVALPAKGTSSGHYILELRAGEKIFTKGVALW